VERIADRVCILDRGVLVEDFSLDELQVDYRRVTLGFATTPPSEEFRIPGIRRVRRADRQLSVLVRGNADAVAAQGRSMNAVSIDVVPITLREVFLESVERES
jgi:ABC-2 type transport system ATP-binding protein